MSYKLVGGFHTIKTKINCDPKIEEYGLPAVRSILTLSVNFRDLDE
jgi:hypothetical protein